MLTTSAFCQTIVQDLKGTTTTQGIWIGTAYLLAQSVTMPFLASISNIFGRPALLMISLIMFTLGSILCASSHGIGQLLAGRSVQGVGGGGIVVLSMVIFTDIVPLRHRPKWYGTVQGAWALGNCVGPVLGGAIAENTTWRWIFYIMFPFCAFGLIAVPLVLTIKPRTETMGKKLARVDWVGSFIFTSAATTFLIAISWGGSTFEWSSAGTIAPLVVGLVGLSIAGYWEAYQAKEPIMSHSLFQSFSGVATYACSGIQGFLMFGQLYYIPFYFNAVLSYSHVRTGASTLPIMVALVPTSIVSGRLITRYNKYRWSIWSGWAICTIGCGLCTMWDANTHIAFWAATLVITGFGHGATLNAQNFAAQAICNDGDEPNAAAMYSFMRHFGSALGVGIGGTTFQNIMALKLGWYGLSKELAKNAEGYITMLHAMPAGTEKTQILESYVYGFKGVFRVYLAISGLAFFLALLIKHYDMNKELRTEHHLEKNNRFSRLVDTTRGHVPGVNGHALSRVNTEAVLNSVPEATGEASDIESAKLRLGSSYSGSTTGVVTPVNVEVPKPVLLEEVREVLSRETTTSVGPGPSPTAAEASPSEAEPKKSSASDRP